VLTLKATMTRIQIAVLLLALHFCSCARPVGPPEPVKTEPMESLEETVRVKLMTKYPEQKPGEVWSEKRLGFSTKTAIRRLINVSYLDSALPEFRFFLTTLETGYFEYREVKAAVAISTHEPFDITICLSPGFANPNPDFLSLFTNAKAITGAEREAVGVDIANVFASIMDSSIFELEGVIDNRFTACLSYSHLPCYRRIYIDFDRNGVTSVSLINPRQEATEASKNQ
jgi:hypothetical protein